MNKNKNKKKYWSDIVTLPHSYSVGKDCMRGRHKYMDADRLIDSQRVTAIEK